MVDITIQVTSDEISSERRINPDWTISHLKARLELITGIPPKDQELLIYATPATREPVKAENENHLVSYYGFINGGQIHVKDLRPVSERLNLHDTSEVERYEMPQEQYEKLENSVLAWKKSKNLGRFDPDHESKREEIVKASHNHVDSKGISVGKRCMANGRKGTVKYVGLVPEIPSKLATDKFWVGIAFDEPVGKNDGSIKGKKYFDANPNYGSFLSPELVEIGDFKEDDYLDDDEL